MKRYVISIVQIMVRPLLWKYKAFHQLNVFELHGIYKLRQEVFVVEQDCVYLDIDGKDQFAEHIFGVDDDGHVMAYCRIIQPEARFQEVSIGRVVTHPTIRKHGIGRLLMEKAFKQIDEKFGNVGIKVEAQLYLKHFYEDLGFVQDGDVFDLDGIEHINMHKQVNSLVS